MAGLLDLEYFADGTPTVNHSHRQNPGRTKFLEATSRGGTNALPGIGVDGIYRDPWGSPYLVTLDLNSDGRARDIMYRKPAVSQDPQHLGYGLYGLVRATNAQGSAVYEAPGPIMVWSAGPDRYVSTVRRADEAVNRDNLLSWRQ